MEQEQVEVADRDDKASELPDWFFEHFPVQSGSEFKTVQHLERYGDRYMTGVMNTSVPRPEATEWYTEQYTSDGWALTEDSTEDVIRAEKEADGHEYRVEVTMQGNDYASGVGIDAARE